MALAPSLGRLTACTGAASLSCPQSALAWDECAPAKPRDSLQRGQLSRANGLRGCLTHGRKLQHDLSEPAGGPSPHRPSVAPGGGVRRARTARAAVAVGSKVEGGARDAVASDDVHKRVAHVSRKTKETEVEVTINLDGTGIVASDSGIDFLDHMLDQLASHGLFDLEVRAEGDTHIDDHHSNEDIALALGTALAKALGERKGINRFGTFTAPLDEALVHVTLDLSGRPHLSCGLEIPTARVGTYDTQLVEHFFQSLVNTSGMTLHIRQLAGKNSHHIIEATFKAFARALRIACERDPRRQGQVPSTKGTLTRL